MSSLVDSHDRKLSQEEIIKIAAKETGGQYTADQVKASLTMEYRQMNALMMREGNTIFVVHQSKEQPTTAMFRPINADTIPRFRSNCRTFAKAIGLAGFKTMITQFKEPKLLGIFKYVIDLHPPFKHMSYKVQHVENGEIAVTVNMGDVK
jgi:hypothetical protein